MVVALDKSTSGAWNAVVIDGGKLVADGRGTHPVESIRFVRGESTVIVFVRRVDGQAEARIAQRTGKALWQLGGWVDVEAATGAVMTWLGSPDGEAINTAELRSASR